MGKTSNGATVHGAIAAGIAIMVWPISVWKITFLLALYGISTERWQHRDETSPGLAGWIEWVYTPLSGMDWHRFWEAAAWPIGGLVGSAIATATVYVIERTTQ